MSQPGSPFPPPPQRRQSLATPRRERPAPPAVVRTAFMLSIGGITVAAIAIMVTALTDPAWADRMARQTLTASGGYTEQDVAGLRGLYSIVGWLTLAVGTGLVVLFAAMMWAGRRWARTTLTLLTVLPVFAFIGRLSGGGVPLDGLWSLAVAAFAIAAVAHMFRPDANAYFGTARDSGAGGSRDNQDGR